MSPTVSSGPRSTRPGAGRLWFYRRSVCNTCSGKAARAGWALKGVGHQFFLDELFRSVSERCACARPAESGRRSASTLTIAAVMHDAITVAERIGSNTPSSIEGIKAGLDRVIGSPVVGDPRIVHLDFRELARHPVGAIGKVYDHAGIRSRRFECRMRAWLADPANR